MEVESSGSEEEIRRKEDVYADNVTVAENTEEREESYAPAPDKFSLDEIPVPKVKDYASTKPPETPAFMSDPIVRKPPEYELHGDVIEADTKLLGKVSTRYFVKADPKADKKAKYVGNRRKKWKKRNPRKNPIRREKKIPGMKKMKKRIQLTRIPRKKMKKGMFRFSFQIQGSSGKPAWRPSVPIYSSSIAANIGKKNYQLHLSTFASHASLQLSPNLHGNRKSSPMKLEIIFTMQNCFRGASLDHHHVLLLVSGDPSTKAKVLFEAIATDVPYIVSEACNEPLGTFVLKILANPY